MRGNSACGRSGGVANYDVAPSGDRFVMVEEPATEGGGATGPPALRLVVNWFEELRARVPD